MEIMRMKPRDLERITGYHSGMIHKMLRGASVKNEVRWVIIQALARTIEGKDKPKFNFPLVGMPDGDKDLAKSTLYPDWEFLSADYYFEHGRKGK